MASNQTCGNCRFFLRFRDPLWEEMHPPTAEESRPLFDDTSPEDYGYCRRMPPSGRELVVHLAGGREIRARGHITVSHRMWCGEWQAAAPETEDETATAIARQVLAGDLAAGRVLADRLIELIPVVEAET